MGAYKAGINIMTDLLMKQTEDYVKTALQYGENSNEFKNLKNEQQLQFNVATDLLGMLMEAEIKDAVYSIK
jgi:hypothetical protein